MDKRRVYFEQIPGALDVYTRPTAVFGIQHITGKTEGSLIPNLWYSVDTRNYDGYHVWKGTSGVRFYTLRQVCLVFAAWAWYETDQIDQSVVVYDGQDWQIVDQVSFARTYRRRMHRDLYKIEDAYWNGYPIFWIN